MTRHAAIIGGGIGGLATAIHLRRHGWTADVYERAADLPQTGTALGMWPQALRALDTLGVGDRVRELGREQNSGAFLRPDGSPIVTLDIARMRRREGDSVVLISRPVLLRLLLEAAGPAGVRFGVGDTDVRAAARTHDVVIAADGLNSAARAALFGPRFKARYVGVTAWRGTVDGDIDSVSETWGDGARFGITPQEGGRTNWFAAARTAEHGRSPDGEVAELRRRFGDWHPAVRGVLAQLDRFPVMRHDLYDLEPALPSYVRGTVALIGDAAHAMTPDLGRGACEALTDGVAVATHLLADPDPVAALRAYDAERRRPTQRLARTSALVNRMAHARRLLPLRDLTMKAAVSLA